MGDNNERKMKAGRKKVRDWPWRKLWDCGDHMEVEMCKGDGLRSSCS